MASTVLEQLRTAHEDIESLERVIVQILNEKPRNHQQRVLHNHKMNNLLRKVQQTATQAQQLYDDPDRTLAQECETMRGRGLFTSFYDQLKRIRDFHRKYPQTTIAPHEPPMADCLQPTISFSGEERFGKYVDLNEFYLRFLNIPLFQSLIDKYGREVQDYDEGIEEDAKDKSVANGGEKEEDDKKKNRRRSRNGRSFSSARSSKEHNSKKKMEKQKKQKKMDYITFLTCFSHFEDIDQLEKLKYQDAYQSYLNDLYAYLSDFYQRILPISDMKQVMRETAATFEKTWQINQRHAQHWDLATCRKYANLSSKSTEASDDNKENSLYCHPCAKQFASEGVFQGHLSGKRHKRALLSMEKQNGKAADSENISNAKKKEEVLEETVKSLVLKELQISKLVAYLTETFESSVNYLELKHTRTFEELQAEIEEEENGYLSDIEMMDDTTTSLRRPEEDDEDEVAIYNPLNLPLGWDGKPIPYWLYKLHGLGIEFKCEICGNHSYWGRRAFDRHFQEWRHAFGMKCLQIPNTKHFHDITLMQDAIQLYEKLKDQLDEESWKAGDEEEFEDSEGNVLNRKTYEDLARQGLL